MTVKEILAFNVEENISYRLDLEDLAFTALQYKVDGTRRPMGGHLGSLKAAYGGTP